MEDFFKYVDNFKKIDAIPTECVFANHTGETPLVTIGIPTYKRAYTLKEALDSAIGQHFNGVYEIMVLDNNSDRNDETEKLMTEYEHVPGVCYYKNTQNLGMAGNWNRIFSLAKSKWVSLLHDDDIIAPCFLNDMLSVAIKYNADVVNSGFMVWKESIEDKPVFSFNKKKYSVISSTLASNHFVHFAGMPSGIIYKRDVYINEGGVNDDYYPSLDYVFHAKLSFKYVYLLYNKKLTIYRRSINDSSNYKTIQKYIPQDYFIRKYIGNILKFPRFYVETISLYYCRSRLNSLMKNKLTVKEISPKPIKKLNPISSILLLVYIYIVTYYYRTVNKIGNC